MRNEEQINILRIVCGNFFHCNRRTLPLGLGILSTKAERPTIDGLASNSADGATPGKPGGGGGGGGPPRGGGGGGGGGTPRGGGGGGGPPGGGGGPPVPLGGGGGAFFLGIAGSAKVG